MLPRWITKLGSKGKAPDDGKGKSSISPWSPAAQCVLAQATREAKSGGARTVTPYHLLMAITKVEIGLAGKILQELGVDLQELCESLADHYGQGQSTMRGSGRFDPEAYEIFSSLAAEEAKALHLGYIGSEALLLAILKQESACAKYIFGSGIRYEPVLAAVKDAIAQKQGRS